ncbi:elongation of very long chain fatty acids protein 7-like [Achroia grisella]|uniref:elongation of very long chain fatty acids protein 7-like n=1 Tax=Achroia grisella TaxID=688607 RepID=UPI0027D2A2A4|nr:elongation of very long chain fatty acids protein 7-like [Achroia grisella]
MSYLEKMDKYLDSLKVGKSAIVDSWFMMSGPIPIMSVVIAYLVVIHVGPKIMKNRPPLIMNKLIAYYNAAQVLLASAICTKVFKLELFKDGIQYAGCRYPHFTQNSTLLDVGWWYFFAKFTELLDTVFFVLRKKNKQITFLHVYHHVIMAIYSWSYLKFASGGEGAILALLNSTVHVFMYTYYLLSGLGPRFQKYLWWKKYVTKLQLAQFVLMLVYCCWTHFSPKCQYSAPFTYFISANVTIFLLLFLNFYVKSYKSRKTAEKKIESDQSTRNGITNGFSKSNGITPDKSEENGIHRRLKNTEELDDVPYQVNKTCGDYTKDGKVYMARRTATAAFGSEYNFDSIITK